MRNVSSLEALYRDYAPKGVKFYFIYKALAHPEYKGYVRPFTLEERLMHVAEAQRTLGSTIPWLCDSMQNELKHALGNAPNSEFIIGPEGNVVRKRFWSKPRQLRSDLEKLVGPVDKPTQSSDLKLKTASAPQVAPRGIVEKIDRPRSMKALHIEPVLKEKGQPFYAKLRAEADDSLLKTGKGKLYLGFRLDPLYHVHWNNLTKPIEVTFESPTGVKITPTSLSGPKPKEPSDIDPREFLVTVVATNRDKPIILKVRYFACNDEQGWCKAVKQEYTLHLKADRDAGWIMSRRGFFGRGRSPRGRGKRGRKK